MGVNVVCLGLQDWVDFDDARFAIEGIPVDHEGEVSYIGGLFDLDDYQTISGVIVFSLGQNQGSARYLRNPNRTEQPNADELETLLVALRGEGGPD